MESEESIKSKYFSRLFLHVKALFLPLALALLFAVQSLVFDKWLNLFSSQYIVRLFLVSFSLGLILYSPSLFFKKRSRYIYLFSVSTFISAIFIAQFAYYEYAKTFLQVSVLNYIGQAISVKGTAESLLSINLLFFISNVALVVVAYAYTRRKIYREIILSKKEKGALLLLIIILAFSGYYFLVSQEDKEWGNSSRLYKDVYDLNTLVEKVGIINFSFEDAFKYFARSAIVDADDKNFLISWSKTQARPQAQGKYFGIDKGKNVIFIQIESLENAVINQTINGQEITPNLNKLASEGLHFTNYYTQIGPGNTADAEFSTLNSLYPLQDDVAFVDYAHNHYNALPSLLVKNGYSTHALHGDVPTFWNRANIYPNLGYQQQISEDSYVMSRPIGKGPSPLGDEDFLTQSVAKIETFKQPFLSTVITESSHTPFELPDDLQTLDLSGQSQLTYTQQQYLQSVHYMDMALGEFMDKLQQESFYKNSVIFLYGDHGSYTNISDVVGQGDNTFPGLVHSQVPLIVLNSGIKSAEIKTPASHLDLFPTVANLMGIKAPKDILGQDIFNTKTPVVTRRNVGSGTINTILTPTLAFIANSDGEFNGGTCLKMPEETSLPIADCKTLYNQQADTVRASDIIIQGNLLSDFLNNVK